jgi:hypothetical protein
MYIGFPDLNPISIEKRHERIWGLDMAGSVIFRMRAASLRMESSWHRVHASGMKGMALQNSPQTVTGPLDQAEFVNGFESVLRTGRIKAAIAAKKRR